MANFYVVATPIGNLGDISSRALDVLSQVDVVLAEDSREAHKLLQSFNIDKQIFVYNQHSFLSKRDEILAMLLSGKNMALITDAGTPGISDPGNELVSFLSPFENQIKIIPIPGASAVSALLSVSGFPCQNYSFFGFFPRNKQLKFLKEISSMHHPIVFFESPHRILKTLEAIEANVPATTKIVLGRELTKLYESIYRGSASEVRSLLSQSLPIKGEIVAVLYNPKGNK